MAEYSVAEAKAKLSELIDRAEKGEAVTITRHGKPVVEVTATHAPAGRRITQADLDGLAKRRASRKVKGSPVRQMLKWREAGDL
ncbi:MAG: type II toxin-antitoxin system prevent-host-death family antitoxin [Hyphomonadaceae bacterium]|nr:type II toxin-antitoxin system prevent-host-death family antitoxin [Hyphomonadaceae bacterium]